MKPHAYMWNCGDEVCGCTCPKVSIFTETKNGMDETVLWEGTFRSESTTEEYAEQCRELVAKAREHDVDNLDAVEAEFACFLLPNAQFGEPTKKATPTSDPAKNRDA